MKSKTNKNKFIGLIFVIFFLISGIGSVSLINSQESSNTLKSPKTSTLQFVDEISETIYQNVDYEFSTVFYDDVNYRNEYTSAYLQTELTSVSDYGFNDSISGIVNNFTEYAENDDITINYGELDSTGTLDIKDANSTDIDSTEGGFFNATHSFTGDANGGNPAGWVVYEVDSDVSVINDLDGHTKVVKIYNPGNAWLYIHNTLQDQTSDIIIEFWHRTDDFSEEMQFHIQDDGNKLVYAAFGGTGSDYNLWDGGARQTFYDNPSNNVWYRHKIKIDISESTFDYYLYNAIGSQLAFADDYDFNQAYIDGVDRVYFWSYWITAPATKTDYLDAMDYSWTAGYNEGRIAECDDATINITVLIDGLNPHLSLEALEFELYSYYKTNESVNTKFYIYDFVGTTWELLDDSVHLNFNDKEGVIHQTPDLEDYINASGIIKVRFLIESDSIISFMFSIDQLGVDIWTKLHLSYTRSFDISGLWKYRWYIIGSDYYSNWTYFEVMDSILNFEAINESEYPTRWILYSNATTPIMDFHDDIVGIDVWDLDDVSERYFDVFESDISSYLLDNYTFNAWDYTGLNWVHDLGTVSGGITWDGTYFYISTRTTFDVRRFTSAGIYTGFYFSTSVQDWKARGITWDGTYFWHLGGVNNEVYRYTSAGGYTGTHFDVGAQESNPSSITWDGTNFWVFGNTNKKAFKYTSAGVYTGVSFDTSGQTAQVEDSTWDGTYFWVIGSNDVVYQYTSAGVYTGVSFGTGTEDVYSSGITWNGESLWMVGYNGGAFQYESLYDISKNYYGSGYTYMQTDETELISIFSSVYATNYTQNSGEYFEVDFQTSSDSLINLILIRNGIIQKTLILSTSGNSDFTRHTAQIIIDESVEFDQLKISSTFEDTDYVKIFDIKSYNYTITGDSADFYLGSKRSEKRILIPDNYSLSIYENGIKKVEKVIELTYDVLYQEIYQPIGIIECRVSLFSTDNIYLNFNEFRISVNRSLNGEYIVFWLLTNLLYVDKETTLNFTIYDQFDTYVDSFIKVADSFIDLYIEVYSLTIKNIMEEKTTLLLNSTNSYELLSHETIEFILPKGNYQLNWTDELRDMFGMVIYLDENSAYELNTSYYSVYFSPFLINGLGLNHDVVRFYIDGIRKDFGFNVITSESVNLTVLDFFNQTIYSNVVNVKDLNEYNIYLNLKSLKIKNEATELVNYTLTRNSINDTGIIFPNEIINYLVVSGNYLFSYTNREDDSTDALNISLTQDRFIVINSTYFDVYFGLFNFDGLGLDPNLFRFYVNGLRRDFGFNTLKRDVNILNVLDYFNASLFNENLDLSESTEYNILVEVYTMIIYNNYSFPVKLKIERNNIELEQILESNFGMSYRMLPDVEYLLQIYHLNGTLLEEKEVELDSNNKIVSFGFFETEVPYNPEPLVFDFTVLMAFIIIISVGGWIVIISWSYMKSDRDIVPEDTRKRHKRARKRSDMFDHRL